METELAIIPKESALQVFTAPDGMAPYLARVRAEIDSFTPDISTKKGRDAVASMAFKVAKTKTYLDGVGKELADVQKEIPKKIDAARKHVRDTLDAWKDEVRRPLTEWEQAEEDRVNRIQSDIAELEAVAADREPRASEVVLDRLNEVKAVQITEDRYQEFTPKAAAAKDAAIAALEKAHTDALKREADAAELQRLRIEAEERARKDREDQIAKEAAGKASREAEQRAAAERDAAEKRELQLKLDAERAQREKEQAEQRAKDAAKETEARLKREAEEKAAAEAAELAKREANKKHKAAINNAAVAAFVKGGLDEAAAKLAVTLIAQKAIPAISVAY